MTLFISYELNMLLIKNIIMLFLRNLAGIFVVQNQ